MKRAVVENDGLTISVVTPSLNQGRYLEEAILSVISQEGGFRIDYLINDGGSTDGSVDIIRMYADKVNGGEYRPRCSGVRIRWVSEKDGGQTQAINNGIRKAEGGLITWINSDDFFLDGAFGKAADYFNRHPDTDFIHADGIIVDERGRTCSEHLPRRFELGQQLAYIHSLGRFGYCMMQQGAFWRRGVHDKVGLLDESFNFAMDAEFFLRTAAAGLKTGHLPEKLAAFRMIEGTKSLSSDTVFWPDMLEIVRRHKGAGAMTPYLMRYFFEEGYYNAYDTGHIEARKESMLSRWGTLDAPERETLAACSDRAFALALLKLCNDAFLKGDVQTARRMAEEAVARVPSLAYHPWMFAYRLKKIWGVGTARLIDRIKGRALHYYGFRYDYRYLYRKVGRLFGARQ